ncbi:MAG: DVU0772 family protein [Syntrophobacteraceae bacterium]
MWGLEELKAQRDVIDRIDWEMTPEGAVETFLEWGTGWSRKGDFVRFVGQDALYFAVYAWEEPPQITLIRRNMRDAEEIAKIRAPEELVRATIEEAGRKPGVGVYALNDALKEWLRSALEC